MGTEKIIEQFKESTKLIDLIQVFLNEFDVVSSEITKINDQRSIDGAEGEQVKRNARLVGLNNLTFSDADLKAITRIQITINTSFGAPNEIMEVASKLGEFTNSEGITIPLSVDFNEEFPATVILTVTGFIADNFKGFYRASLEKTKSGGVRLIIKNPSPTVNHFAFDTVGSGFDSGAKFVGEIL